MHLIKAKAFRPEADSAPAAIGQLEPKFGAAAGKIEIPIRAKDTLTNQHCRDLSRRLLKFLGFRPRILVASSTRATSKTKNSAADDLASAGGPSINSEALSSRAAEKLQ